MRCVGSFWRPAWIIGSVVDILGLAAHRLGTALCTSVLANPAFALLSRIWLKAPAPSTTKVLSLEMRFELKSLVQSEVPRRSAPISDTLEERPHMCPMWTTSGCLARRWPNHDSLNATRGTGLGVGFRGLRTPAYLSASPRASPTRTRRTTPPSTSRRTARRRSTPSPARRRRSGAASSRASASAAARPSRSRAPSEWSLRSHLNRHRAHRGAARDD